VSTSTVTPTRQIGSGDGWLISADSALVKEKACPRRLSFSIPNCVRCSFAFRSGRCPVSAPRPAGGRCPPSDQLYVLNHSGGNRKPAVRVVLDALPEAAASVANGVGEEPVGDGPDCHADAARPLGPLAHRRKVTVAPVAR
jgi:hypothetical protein